uniref:Glutamine amidotransferase domain-containing protein n=1 Tax=Nelumbo nucifera TaxID=4432 RepID=A0A822YCM8_NELNU|nr:TPA_asm: hypothetical protein HUJ06_030507 [Nelumbo nucifera]
MICISIVTMARILTIVPGDRHPVDDSALLDGLWVPILDGNCVVERLLPIRHQLPDCVAELQPGVPHRGALASFHERRPQRNWSLGIQFHPQRCHPSLLLELLCEGAPRKEKDWLSGMKTQHFIHALAWRRGKIWSKLKTRISSQKVLATHFVGGL